MTEIEEKSTPPQLCTIRIMFPAVSDEQALDVKKRIDAALVDVPKHRCDFSITTAGALRTDHAL